MVPLTLIIGAQLGLAFITGYDQTIWLFFAVSLFTAYCLVPLKLSPCKDIWAIIVLIESAPLPYFLRYVPGHRNAVSDLTLTLLASIGLYSCIRRPVPHALSLATIVAAIQCGPDYKWGNFSYNAVFYTVCYVLLGILLK